VKISSHALWVVLASVGACATPMHAMRADNQRLSQSVAEMRAERRAQERKIRDLELELAMLKEKTPKTEVVPQLPVEVVAPPASPDGGRVVGIAEDGTEIVYEGDAALGKPAVIEIEAPRRLPTASRDSDRMDRDTVRRTPVSARTSRTPVRSEVASDTAGAEYRAAVELVRSGSKDEAVASLRKFLAEHPRHEYADNAQYWLGEAFYGAKDYKNALVEFRATIETYPRGNKVPDALLKVGYCYAALGQTEKARAVLEQVVNLYPKTEPAALAAKRLETP
jgi:tol-pal system protein YbgF